MAPGCFLGIQRDAMETYRNLCTRLCSYENLEVAFRKARKGKTLKDYVINFESELEKNITQLKEELETLTYSPAPLTTFLVRDPKTRKISASHFRDRVVHHALCNIIEPILEKEFIHDSFANQKGKGTHMAIKRYERFLRRVSFNRKYEAMSGVGQRKLFNDGGSAGYALKADISHYFDTVDHETLLHIIQRKIKDVKVLWLVKTILANHKTEAQGKGMPIGNLTSQFFANVYLNELDRFVKHGLRAKYYIRYVDDFVILHRDRTVLKKWKEEIGDFLRHELKIQLHKEKTRIIPLKRGITLLGFRVFRHYRLLKRSNARRIWKRLDRMRNRYDAGEITREKVRQSFEGWLAYAKFANTYDLRERVLARFEELFYSQASSSTK